MLLMMTIMRYQLLVILTLLQSVEPPSGDHARAGLLEEEACVYSRIQQPCPIDGIQEIRIPPGPSEVAVESGEQQMRVGSRMIRDLQEEFEMSLIP